MAIIKCKMCGGDIVLAEDRTTGTCEYCGSTMTFPRVSDEQRLNLFNRANHFRRQNDFDKAIAAYDKILDLDDTDAEAHWGAVLSRYGIEYVEDPITHERIPTCHRVQLGSILTDADYLAAVEHAPDTASRDLYESEARRIADIQKGILAISAQEKPYDVFICYKETDDSGSRTKDSTLAQDIYYQLTNEGYKVFFSRITLEDKLGQQYEPYIFAALNSAKVMLVIGTKPEHFNAVWVKNEWSRFLDLMKKDRNKLLIPCYRDMDPYDLPEELSALQSQDMSKIGFIQDLLHGVKKVLNSGREPKPVVVTSTAGPGVASLHKRAVLFLEDGDWDSANEYFDRILDIDPEFAPAYIGKVQVANQARKEDGLARCAKPLKDNPDYQKALRFADEQHRAIYEGYNRAIEDRLERERKEAIYREADALEKRAAVEADFIAAAKKYDDAGEIRDAKTRAADCRAKAAAAKKEAERQAEEYRRQLEQEREERKRQEEEACKEAERRAEQQRIETEKRAEQERIERERKEREERIAAQKRKKRNKAIAIVMVIVVALAAAGFAGYKFVLQPRQQYATGKQCLENGDYDGAIMAFSGLASYSDSKEKTKEAYYFKATELLASGDDLQAHDAFLMASDYPGAEEQAKRIEDYNIAEAAYNQKDYLAARPLYTSLGDYRDSAAKLQRINELLYAAAKEKMEAGNIAGAYSLYSAISDYADSTEITGKVNADYQEALYLWESGDKIGAETALSALAGWNDVDAKLESLREDIADDAAKEEDYDTAITYYGKLKNPTDATIEKLNAVTQAKAYKEAVKALQEGDLKTAYQEFVAAGDHADASEHVEKLLTYMKAETAFDSNDLAGARILYAQLGDFLDSDQKLETCNAVLYSQAMDKQGAGDIAGAHETYSLIGGYEDSADKAQAIESAYNEALDHFNKEEYDKAHEAFAALKNYADSEVRANESAYRHAEALSADGLYDEAASVYEGLGEYLDSTEQAKEAHYKYAESLWSSGDLNAAAEEYKALGDYDDALMKLQKVSSEIADAALMEKDYATALTAYQRLEQTDEIKAKEYELAQACYEEGHFAEATSAYETLGQYELSLSKLPIARYAWADQLFNEGHYAEAAEQFALLGGMTDSADRARESTYQLALQTLEDGEYDIAKSTFGTITGYSDADTMAKECDYRKADALLSDGDYAEAQAIFEVLSGYSNSSTKAKQCVYDRAEVLFAEGKYEDAAEAYSSVDYEDSATKAKQCVYNRAELLFAEGKFKEAAETYESVDYEDSIEKAKLSSYSEAEVCYSAGRYEDALKLFEALGEYRDSADRAKDCCLQQGNVLMLDGDYAGALNYFERIDCGESAVLAAKCHFAIGQKAIVAGNMDGAVREYAQAASLPEAREALLDAAKDYASINEIEKAVQALWMIRDDDEARALLKEIGDLKMQSGNTDVTLLAYCAMGSDEPTGDQKIFTEDGYSKLSECLDKCNLLPEDAQFKEAIRYNFAKTAFVNEEYDLAAEVFESISGYNDAATQAQESQYQKGMALLADGDYDGSTAVFKSISGYNDAATQAQESQYQKATVLNAAGKYDEAYAVYTGLKGYKDVDSIIEKDDNIAAAAAAAAWRAQFTSGNTVTFGCYDQDGDASNGMEAIEWIVLANDGETATLLSKYGLDAKPYNTEFTDVTWETSTLRKWLNWDFLTSAFTAEEQAQLATVTVTADKNPKYSTSPGNDTQDKVYLLSIDEVSRYFASDIDRVCMPTKTAVVNGAYTSSFGTCWWWLRSPGNSANRAAYVHDVGSVNNGGSSVSNDDVAVRPVVVLRLS